MFEVTGWQKEAEEDVFESGMYGNCSSFCGSDRFSGHTLEDLIEDLQNFFWCQWIHIGACDTTDQIVLERYEDADGCRVDKTDPIFEEWKKGKARLWVARYYVNVEEVVRKPAVLEEKEYEL